MIGPLGDEFGGGSAAVIGEVEAGGDAAAEQSDLAGADEACALPDSGGNEVLHMLTGSEIRSKSNDGGAAVGEELEHLDGIAEVEVEEFVGGEAVHLGESAGFEKIVDGGAEGAGAARQVEDRGGGVGAAEEASLDGMGLKL